MPKKHAFVKYTKKGALIPGSLVITSAYPKETANGVWKEVPMELFCCAPITTTTSFPSNSYYVGFAFSTGLDACNSPVVEFNVYSADSPLIVGSYVYSEPNLTGSIADGFIAFDGSYYQLSGNQIIDIQTCNAPPAPFSNFSNYSNVSGPEACFRAQDQFTVYSSASPAQGVIIYIDNGLSVPVSNGYYSFGGNIYTVTNGLGTIASVTSCPATNAYSYTISQTDLDAATGNTLFPSFNGQVWTYTSDNGSGNADSKYFTSAGSYNHWMCSIASETPAFYYYANNVQIAVGLASIQTNIGPC